MIPTFGAVIEQLYLTIEIMVKCSHAGPNNKNVNIGITHVFSYINICRVPRMLFEHETDRPSVQHHPRGLASVNVMKQTCVIVILAYFTLFQLNLH